MNGIIISHIYQTLLKTVIGSVTIGASSSFSSGPFANGGSQSYSSKPKSFFFKGKDSSKNDRDDMSSLSSNRSSLRKNPRYRPLNHRHPKAPIRNRVKSKLQLGSQNSIGSGSRSKISRHTTPMVHQRRQNVERQLNGNGEVSFGDWKAVGAMTKFSHSSEASVTDRSAVETQGRFFFNTILCPDAPPSSDVSPNDLSWQSLPNMHLCKSSLHFPLSCLFNKRRPDISIPSLHDEAESYFRDASFIQQQSESGSTSRDQPSSSNVFVSWRKEGFTSSLRLSDDNHSDESALSASFADVPGSRVARLRLFPSAKSIFRKKTRAKDWFSFKHRQYHHRQYHNINKGIELQEDPSVASMKTSSSLSCARLLPLQLNTARADLPNLVLARSRLQRCQSITHR